MGDLVMPSVTLTLTDVQRRATVVALHDRLFETQRYISGSGYTPCHPTCEHCVPRAAHFAEIKAGLVERERVIQSVLDLLFDPPPGSGSPTTTDKKEQA